MNRAWLVAGAQAASEDTGTMRERVGRVLRERILSGVLEPGTRIDLDLTAAEFETSRTPVREACQELAQDGVGPHRAAKRGIGFGGDS